MNNAKNIGMAFQGYLNMRNRLPNATTWGESPEAISAADPRLSIINDTTGRYFGNFKPAGTDGSPTDIGPLHSWVVDLLPHLDAQSLYNDFNRHRVWFDPGRSGDDPTRPSNLTISKTDLAILRCPNDQTIIRGTGNLSYAVNLGLTLWHNDGINGLSFCPSPSSFEANTITWGPLSRGEGTLLFKRTAMMFQGTFEGRAPWDLCHTTASITDGMATTVLLAENVLGGAAPADPGNGRLVETHWSAASPWHVGFTASQLMCPVIIPGCTPFHCDATDLSPDAGKDDGPGWAAANPPNGMTAINGGLAEGAVDGYAPYVNAEHSGGFVAGMADGSVRFITGDVNGAVWAKLLSPAGQTLPAAYRQLPLAADQVPGSR